MATTNASSRVSSIWELCETILKLLPCDDLARARRVSPVLKEVIDQTAILQQSLFLQHRPINLVWILTGDSVREVRETDKLLAGSNIARHVKEAISNGEPVTELTVLELHPAPHVKRICTSRSLGWYLGCCAMDEPMFSFSDAADVVSDHIDPVADVPRHSIVERMFSSQPPVRDIRFALKFRCGGRLASTCPYTHFTGLTPYNWITIHDDTGITFGQLRDRLQMVLVRNPTATLDYLMFGGGFAGTTKEKQAMEAAGALSCEQNSIFCCDC